jgi:two-component system, response regulator PdtaR
VVEPFSDGHDGHHNKSNGRLKALIVEDEAIVAEGLKLKLQELGFNVIGVTGSGREAIECAKETHPDLVLMDFQIRSDLDGTEAAVVIQGMTESPIPIVFLTAHAASEFPLLRAVAPYVYLRKPFSDADLKQILDDAIKLRAPA